MVAKRKRKRSPRQVYAFIDTNIFLDFYRDSTEATLSLLDRLIPVRDRVISTYQVEMEFLKNRQKILKESLEKLKSTSVSDPPAFLADVTTTKSLKDLNKTAKKKREILRARIVNLLRSPTRYDKIYKALDEIFKSTSAHVLTRDMAIRHSIKRKAFRRFILGYPPRKASDLSIGDALNWEWIVHCGQNFQGRIIIVSRDSDYGLTVGKSDHFLNDQLLREFRDRVGPRKSIALTTRLSDALRELRVPVPEDEIEAESELIDRTSAGVTDRRAKPDAGLLEISE